MTEATAPTTLSFSTQVVGKDELEDKLGDLIDGADEAAKQHLAKLGEHALSIVEDVLSGAERLVVSISGHITADDQGSIVVSAYSVAVDAAAGAAGNQAQVVQPVGNIPSAADPSAGTGQVPGIVSDPGAPAPAATVDPGVTVTPPADTTHSGSTAETTPGVVAPPASAEAPGGITPDSTADPATAEAAAVGGTSSASTTPDAADAEEAAETAAGTEAGEGTITSDPAQGSIPANPDSAPTSGY